MKHKQSQESFAALGVAEEHNDDWLHKLVDHEVFSGIVPAKCEQLGLDTNCSAILDAWNEFIAYEIEREQNGKPAASQMTSTPYTKNVMEPLRRINNSGPPTRFRRRGAMWKIITSRIVEHASETTAL
jgi:hypothetical protein